MLGYRCFGDLSTALWIRISTGGAGTNFALRKSAQRDQARRSTGT
jgi:hypothetical protein